jgi:hypothetical protein
VIISDLQHIESATESKVQGSKRRGPSRWYHWQAKAEANPGNFGADTKTFTSTDTLTVEDQFSNSEF